MDKQAVIGFVKKNLISLICAIVALLAVAAAFYPISGMTDALKQAADQHASLFATLTGYNTKARTTPQLDPDQTKAGDLKLFPNAAVVEAGTKAVARLHEQSAEMVAYADEATGIKVHHLLVPNALPNPLSDTDKFTFAKDYKLVLSTDPLVTGNPAGLNPASCVLDNPTPPPTPLPPDENLVTAHALNIANDVLQSGLPPDPKAILARQTWLRDNVFQPRVISRGGVPTNQEQVDQDLAEAARLVPEQMTQEVATKKKMYQDKDALALNANITSSANPSLPDIWFAQLALWMQQDVASAIAEANAKSTKVADSPVKRLVRLDLPLSQSPVPMYTFAPAASGSGVAPVQAPARPGTKPVAVDNAELPQAFTASPTGRVCNGMYDVVQFNLTVVVAADQVNGFLQTLSRGRLITVYNQDAFTVDSVADAAHGFLYGDTPVVTLVLSGEELFLRDWTIQYMPEKVQVALGLLPGATEPLTGSPTGGSVPNMGGRPMAMPGVGG